MFSKILSAKSSRFILAPLFVFATSASAADEPDNSEVNQRDSSAKEMTAQDQGNSKRDIGLTQKIRQEVVKRSSFSTDAKNIKIITLNGLVTLKGPVKSTAEKAEIEKIAKKVAGAAKVSSQIEVEVQ